MEGEFFVSVIMFSRIKAAMLFRTSACILVDLKPLIKNIARSMRGYEIILKCNLEELVVEMGTGTKKVKMGSSC